MTLEYENLNISPKIEITENDEQLSFRLNCSVLVENSKFPKKETLASSWGKILLKYGHRITGKSMNIYELFDPDNGWINSKNSLKILYGIQIDAIQKNGIWRFHFSDSFFNGKEKEHGIRVEYEEDFIIVEEEILKFHSKIFSDENSGFLGEFKDFKLLEECMQCAHGVRIDDSKISEILPIAYNLKLFNVIRYCEQKLIQQFPRGQQIPIEMVLKYRMRRYLGYLLENEKSKKKVKQLFYIIDAPCFTARTYDRIKGNYVYPAVTIWYQNTKEWVWEFMRKAYEEDGALNMVGDGSFDSRGRSALYLRYVLMDSKYHLALDFEIVRQKTGEKRYDMEKEGFEKSFSRLVEEASKYLEPGAVKSFTSDRSKSIATSMRLNFPQIEHNFDSWHYIRNITLDIMKADSVWDQLIPVTDDDKMSDSSYEYESDLDTRASDIDSVWDHLVLMDDEGENLDDLEESEDDESYELRRDLRQ
ncbi:hypothetical protein L3Y34_009739 [Caenorhabditis briggsae]|uniref:Uncharacterized protein n=1 Tax=Caenorhabditis briggsae TaxID=6238 RepID=A0AAE9ACW2_CAEBR|nr:hypothetical protein L3Y34_009739 [Caenorhabditis briggsae]